MIEDKEGGRNTSYRVEGKRANKRQKENEKKENKNDKDKMNRKRSSGL